MGDVRALGDEGEEALEGLRLLGVEPAIKERGDVNVVGIVVQVGVGADPEHQRRRLAQALRRSPKLREHRRGRLRIRVSPPPSSLSVSGEVEEERDRVLGDRPGVTPFTSKLAGSTSCLLGIK